MTATDTTRGVDLDVAGLMRLRLLLARRGARRPAAAPAPGATQRRRGRGLETFDVRPWSDGDDPRSLDRNVTARTGAPHVRAFHEERERSVVYLVDFRPSMLFGTRRAFRSVAAAEAAIACAWRTLDMQGRAALAAIQPDGLRYLGAAASARSFAPLLEALAGAHRDALDSPEGEDPPLAAVLTDIDAVAGAAALTLATGLDTPGETFDAVAGRIARRRDLGVLLIADRFELAPPPGQYPWRYPGAAGWLRIARGDPAMMADARPGRLRSLGARVLEVDAGLELAEVAGALERFDGRSG